MKTIYDTELKTWVNLVLVTFSVKPNLLLKKGVDVTKRHIIRCRGNFEASLAEARLRKVIGAYNIRRSYAYRVKNKGLQLDFRDYFEDRLSA